MKNTAFLVYLPVYHRGFAQLFAQFPDVKNLILLTKDDLAEFAPTHKDLHALDLDELLPMLTSLARFAQIIPAHQLDQLANRASFTQLIIPAADVAIKNWAVKYLPAATLQEADIFLRWHRDNALTAKPVASAQSIAAAELVKLLPVALREGQKSSDWWRQVGCVLLFPDGSHLQTHNQHLPDDHTPYIVGDVRAQFHRGEHFELTTAIHAEAAAIAAAARAGRATAGAKIIITDFPCPVCARLIAAAGITELYYHQGYSMLDGEDILRAAGVKIFQIK